MLNKEKKIIFVLIVVNLSLLGLIVTFVRRNEESLPESTINGIEKKVLAPTVAK